MTPARFCVIARGMKSNKLHALVAACWLLIVSLASAAEPAAAEKAGLSVGQKAPAFTLKDHEGRDVSLDALLKKGPVALVFYRSADW